MNRRHSLVWPRIRQPHRTGVNARAHTPKARERAWLAGDRGTIEPGSTGLRV